MAKTIHIPVLLKEVTDFIEKRHRFVVDVTVGFGGHSREILERFPKIQLLGIDQDEEALVEAKKTLKKYEDRVTLVKGNFRNIENILEEEGIDRVDVILADLGVSSYQLDKGERGFSFKKEAKLDMRMDRSAKKTAKDVVNSYSEYDLANVIYEYGDERYSRRIAKRIVEKRRKKPIETTTELRQIILEALPKSFKWGRIDPATKTFQAIRIEVNAELESLKGFLKGAKEVLSEDGILEVITFHSLEDRIVKSFVKEQSSECICPKEELVCKCNHKKTLTKITRKPILPSNKEMRENSRSRSAKLRVAKKV